MNQEDEEFNRIERESKMRVEAVYQELQKYREKMLKRTWVGLTPEEEEEIITKAHSGAGWRFYIRETEDKLREKNT
jgi:hypothetical protein